MAEVGDAFSTAGESNIFSFHAAAGYAGALRTGVA
jgi:hypothetical protein